MRPHFPERARTALETQAHAQAEDERVAVFGIRSGTHDELDVGLDSLSGAR